MLRFVPFQPAIDPSFWQELSRKKLEEWKLETDNLSDLSALLLTDPPKVSLTYRSFSSNDSDAVSNSNLTGKFKNLNTIEEFKRYDRADMIQAAQAELFGNLQKGMFRQNFILVTFADLKKYSFSHTIGTPSLQPPGGFGCAENLQLDTNDAKLSQNMLEELKKFHGCQEVSQQQPATTTEMKKFHSRFQSSRCTVVENSGLEYAVWRDSYSGADTSTFDASFRNFLTLCWLNKVGYCDAGDDSYFRVLVLRPRFSDSRYLKVTCKATTPGSDDASKILLDPSQKCFTAGWIKDQVTSSIVHTIQLAQWLDPAAIASSAVDLNIKLMKWRLVPELEPEKIQNLKFLLLGSGTLGCSIARNLLGWGVRHITFLDSGIVNYSNPVRQSLFTHADAKEKRKKAECAFSRAKEVMPELGGGFVNLEIPMPGHAHSYNADSIGQLEDLIRSHDVVCMLTDSRESRWLPTLMVSAANAEGKNILGVTVALGFDSFVVMTQTVDKTRRACYFCNDVTAPTDSITERTLDRQCTVVRPGVSNLASSVATELIAALTQHKDGFAAGYSEEPQGGGQGAEKASKVEEQSLLGTVPPQIRGYISDWRLVSIPTEPFQHCVCCSSQIIDEYQKDKLSFVKICTEDNRVLEQVSGLEDMKKSLETRKLELENLESEDEDMCLL